MDPMTLGARGKARSFFQQAYRHQRRGELLKAIECYKASLAHHETAEAHTFLGWTYSFMRMYEEAIAQCEQAIRVDPEFGNPYNDIGVYLIELQRPSDAIPWLQRALDAPRYDPRQFPWYNLGRVYEQLGAPSDAMRHYRRALELDPDYALARDALKRLLGRMN